MKNLLFSALLLLLAVSCETDETQSQMPSNPILSFEVTTSSEVVSGVIDVDQSTISLSGITSGYQIKSVNYALAEGVTIYPDPADRLGVWSETESYQLRCGDQTKLYTTTLVDYVSPKVIPDAKIYPYKLYGCVTEHHLYDLKDNESTVGTYSNAVEFFQTQDMDGIRIPIWACYSSDADPSTACAHPSAGVINESIYSNFVTRINNSVAARGGNDFTVMASIKSNWGGVHLPAWVSSTGTTAISNTSTDINYANYAILIRDFLVYMKKETGITVDVLGPYNEGVGLAGPATYAASTKTLVDALKPLLDVEGIPMPKIIGPDPYFGNTTTHTTQVSNLIGYGLSSVTNDYYMHKVGLHYYSADGHSEYYTKYHGLVTAATQSAAQCKFWATEPHWNTSVTYTAESGVEMEGDLMLNAQRAITCLWTHSDLGMEMVCWWDWPTPSSSVLRSQLMRATTMPLHGAQPVLMEDHDDLYDDNFGSTEILYTALQNCTSATMAALDVSDYNDYENTDRLFTRAFIEGNRVKLFILNVVKFDNIATCTEYSGYKFEVDDAVITSAVSYEQWVGDSTATGYTYTSGTLSATSDSYVSVPIPKRSIICVEFDIEPKSEE